MDNMEMFSLSTSFLTFFSGLMLFAPEGLSDNDKIIYSLLIVVSNALFFAVSIYKLVSLMLVCVCTPVHCGVSIGGVFPVTLVLCMAFPKYHKTFLLLNLAGLRHYA